MQLAPDTDSGTMPDLCDRQRPKDSRHKMPHVHHFLGAGGAHLLRTWGSRTCSGCTSPGGCQARPKWSAVLKAGEMMMRENATNKVGSALCCVHVQHTALQGMKSRV